MGNINFVLSNKNRHFNLRVTQLKYGTLSSVSVTGEGQNRVFCWGISKNCSTYSNAALL